MCTIIINSVWLILDAEHKKDVDSLWKNMPVQSSILHGSDNRNSEATAIIVRTLAANWQGNALVLRKIHRLHTLWHKFFKADS